LIYHTGFFYNTKCSHSRIQCRS